MKLSDYSVWFDVMHSTDSGNNYDHFVIPYNLESFNNLIAKYGRDHLDIAVVVYGHETLDSWYTAKNGVNRFISEVRTFIAQNSAGDLKNRYLKGK